MKVLLLIKLDIAGFNLLNAQISVIDKKGTIRSVDSSLWSLSGTNIYNKNTGNVGIGTILPIYKLDVTGKLRVTDSFIANSGRFLNVNSGSVTLDSILVIDPLTGIIKRISASALNRNDSTTASNGLNLNGKDVRLGGTLSTATTITTSATNTLSLAGLQNGLSSDSVLVISSGSGGVVRKVVSPQIFPQILVDVDRNTAYTVTATFSNIIYNAVSTNVGTAYNTTTGVFTAPATGNYQIITNDAFSSSTAADNGGSVNIVVNGAIDISSPFVTSPYNAALRSTSIASSTVVSMTAGQTVSIQVAVTIGAIAPLVGAGQHVLKIIRLN